ncbi:MAG: DUF599 family protein [Brevundimonas sp.]|nr:MAG: DUF599 family protein [Brevundimonas sp.]
MTTLDYLALGLFFVCWLGYDPLLKLLAHRTGSLNDDMTIVRKVWMTAMTHREIRLVDSQLMGHSINSASFFASTNLLLIAAVGGILFGGQTALDGFASVGAEAVPTRVLEGKLALILVCLVRGLLDFIWSLRQMNYTLALIGAAPEIHTEADRVALGEAATNLLNPALGAFSQGVRGYYFALAAAAWLFGPQWLAAGVTASFCLLVWRQSGSPAARAIRSARRLLEP